MAEANWALKTRQVTVQRFARWRDSDAVTDTSVTLSKQKTWVVKYCWHLLPNVACAGLRAMISSTVSVVHQGINDGLSFSVWINECAPIQLRLSHCWAPDARACVTGRWVDYADAGCFVLLCVLLSRDKRSNDEQSWNSACTARHLY